MIPVEYLWGILFLLLAIIGLSRGPSKELGATAVLLLTLFVLKVGWDQGADKIVPLVQGWLSTLTREMIRAIYFSLFILFVAYISYEGVTLGFAKKFLFQEPRRWLWVKLPGLLVGFVNGYLVMGTVWNVLSDASYFRPLVSVISGSLSDFHNALVQYLPVSLMSKFGPFPVLILGMLLLLAMIFK